MDVYFMYLQGGGGDGNKKPLLSNKQVCEEALSP